MPTLDRSRLTDPFGNRAWRVSSSNPTGRHSGIDIGGPAPITGPPYPYLRSPADGVIHRIGVGIYPARAGNQMVIRHNDGTGTYLGHWINAQEKVGDRVKRGQAVAVMHRSGLSKTTGIHVHLEHWTNASNSNSYVDPLPWLARHGWGFVAAREGTSTITRLYDVDAWWERHEGGRFAGQITATRQAMLREHGFYGGILDGDRGPLTIAAEIAFLQNPPTIPALDAAPEGDLTVADITAITTAIAELPAKFRAVLDSYRVDIHYTGGLRSVFLPAGITAISQNAARANLRAAELEKVVEVIASKVGLDPDVIREAAKQGASEALAEGLDVEATVNIARKEG